MFFGITFIWMECPLESGSIHVFRFLHSFSRAPFRTCITWNTCLLGQMPGKFLLCLPAPSSAPSDRHASLLAPSPTCLPSVHRFAGHRSRPGKEETDFWAKLHTSKETKNLPAAGVGSATGRDTHHPGDCSHHLPGTVLLPPTGREQ